MGSCPVSGVAESGSMGYAEPGVEVDGVSSDGL
jgi:hypothetical protein